MEHPPTITKQHSNQEVSFWRGQEQDDENITEDIPEAKMEANAAKQILVRAPNAGQSQITLCKPNFSP